MTETAIVVSGDPSPNYDVGPTSRPMTMTPGGRLRVDTGAGGATPNADGSANIGGRDGATKATSTNPVPTYSPGLIYSATTTFTRPADTTAYTAPTGATQGDLIANSTTAGPVALPAFAVPSISNSGTAEGIVSRLSVNFATRKAAFTVRAHVFVGSTAPTFTNGDNGAIACSNIGVNTRYIGFVDLVTAPGVAGSYGVDDSLGLEYSKGNADSIYVALEALSAITPANAEVITVGIGVQRTL